MEGLAKELKLHHATAEVRLLAVLEYGVESVQVLLLALSSASTLANEEIIELSVAVGEVQDALCLLLVATCASTLLHVALETLGHGVVDDEAYIALVDAHAEGNCSDDHLNLIIHPIALDFLSASVGQLSVIEVAPHAMIAS